MKFFKENKNILILILGAFFLRFALSLFGTLQLDQGTFISWSMNLAENGFRGFYNGWSDYLPGYLYVLWFLGKINVALPWIPQVLLYKLPAILSDLATGYLIYKIVNKSKGQKWGLIGAGIYLFNPAILANSALWGQVDSLTALTSLLAIYLLPSGPEAATGRRPSSILLSAASLAIGTLIKPQVAFILPVILFMMLKSKWNFRKIVIYLTFGLLVFILGFVPFWNHSNLIVFIYQRLGISANQYQYTSVNALNFWGLFGFWKPDNFYSQIAGYLAVLIALIVLCIKLWKAKHPEYYLVSFVFAASFVFFTRMHERHLLPLFAPLAIVAIENPLFLIPYLGFSIIYVANLYYAYKWITNDFVQVFPDMILKLFSLFNVGAVVFTFYSIYKNLNWSWSKIILSINRFIDSKNKKEIKVPLPKINLSNKTAKIILASILVFAFVTRTFNLGSPDHEYFDEVYHAFTARVILHSDPKAWEWWNTPPEGFAYEWTHPPLAKLGMVVGMAWFGENSFGWRIPGAMLGVGSVWLVYLIGKKIFSTQGGPASGGDDEAVGLLAAGVFSLDGLPLVLSRIGMNDSYLLFFVLLSLLLFMNGKNFWSALAFGFAIASKWSAIWAIPILFVLWMKRKNKFQPAFFLSFLLLPFIIYLLTYLPMFLSGHGLDIWWGMQEQMWWYHTGLKATHPYTSLWWSWPFLVRPIYLYTSDEVGGMVSRIYAMGNPFIFWFGFISVFFSMIYTYVEKNKKLGLVVFSYLIFFVPWAASPRIMFLYHYLPSIPFLAIATAYVLRRNPKLIFVFLSASLLAFIYFYPHWAGLQIPLWLDRSYYWIDSWR